MYSCKRFYQKPWILSGPASFRCGIDFNFLLTSSLVICTIFCFSNGIFVFCFVNPFCIPLMLDFYTPYSFPKCCCIFSIRVSCPLSLPSRFLKNLPRLISKFLLSWNCFILLSYRFTLVAFAVILSFSSSITNVNAFLLSTYFWSSQSFSFFLFFFHFPANHASILLRSFFNLLISVRILLF